MTKDVPLQLRAIGHVSAFSTVSVRSQVDGLLANVKFKEGDAVKAGDLIFQIDPQPFEAALNQAQSLLDKDIAQNKNAEVNLRRETALFEQQIEPAQAYDQARANADSQKATVAADQAAVDTAKLQLSYCAIRSPIDGVVGKLLLNAGNVVKRQDTPLVVINQIKPIYVDFTVPEQELARIRKFIAVQKMSVEASISGQEIDPPTGELTVIDNAVDTTTGTIQLRAVFPNEDAKLWPGQFVNVVFTLTTQSNAVVVPSEAVQIGQQGEYVFVVEAESAVNMRPVVVGGSVGEEIVLEKGLQPGEEVVTAGQLRLVPGSKVEIQNRKEMTAVEGHRTNAGIAPLAQRRGRE